MSKKKKTPYETLDIPKDAKVDAIKKAFRKRSKETHPDRGGDPVEFKAVVAAYKVLSDDSSRARYDQTGDDSPRDSNQQSAFLSHLARIFGNVLESMLSSGRDPATVDLVQMVVGELTGMRSKMQSERSRMTKIKNHLTPLTAKFQAEEGAVNFFADVIQFNLTQVETSLATVDAELEKCEAGIAYLKKFKQVVDKADQAQQLEGLLRGWSFSPTTNR